MTWMIIVGGTILLLFGFGLGLFVGAVFWAEITDALIDIMHFFGLGE